MGWTFTPLHQKIFNDFTFLDNFSNSDEQYVRVQYTVHKVIEAPFLHSWDFCILGSVLEKMISPRLQRPR